MITPRKLFAVLPILAGLACAAARADEARLGLVKNYEFVYSATEPRPKQYQIYIKGVQLDSNRSCAVFTAHVATQSGRQLVGGVRESVASFLLEPADFPVSVWLEDVRVESWADWYARNQATGRQGYGNPCLESSAPGKTEAKVVQLPGNPNMPCDSLPAAVATGSAAQHLAVANGSLRIEITAADALDVYTIALANIDKSTFRIAGLGAGDPRSGLEFTASTAQVQSVDRLGNRFNGSVPGAKRFHLTCKSDADAISLKSLLVRTQ